MTITREQLDAMRAEANGIGRMLKVFNPSPTLSVLWRLAAVCDNVAALADEVERSHDFIRIIAALAGGWNEGALLAAAARFFGLTVQEFEKVLNDEAKKCIRRVLGEEVAACFVKAENDRRLAQAKSTIDGLVSGDGLLGRVERDYAEKREAAPPEVT